MVGICPQQLTRGYTGFQNTEYSLSSWADAKNARDDNNYTGHDDGDNNKENYQPSTTKSAESAMDPSAK